MLQKTWKIQGQRFHIRSASSFFCDDTADSRVHLANLESLATTCQSKTRSQCHARLSSLGSVANQKMRRCPPFPFALPIPVPIPRTYRGCEGQSFEFFSGTEDLAWQSQTHFEMCFLPWRTGELMSLAVLTASLPCAAGSEILYHCTGPCPERSPIIH